MGRISKHELLSCKPSQEFWLADSESEQMYVNVMLSEGTTSTENFTAYVNPYMVVTQGDNCDSYTKHFYIGSE